MLQRGKRDYYLSMKHLGSFNDPDLSIANAWLDPEVRQYGNSMRISLIHPAQGAAKVQVSTEQRMEGVGGRLQRLCLVCLA